MATYSRKSGENLKVDLNVSYGTKSLSKSINKTFSEEIIQRKEVDNTDNGVQVVSFNDAAFLASSLKDAKGILICNEGEVGAELNMNIAGWNGNVNNTEGGLDVKRMLQSGEFFYLPSLSLLKGSGNGSVATGAVLDNQVPSTDMYVDSGVNLDAHFEDIDKFKE